MQDLQKRLYTLETMNSLKIFQKSVFILAFAAAFTACKSNTDSEEKEVKAQTEDSSDMGLKDYYEDYFPMGVAVAPNSVKGKSAELIKKEYNSITPENVMKMGPIHPEKDKFYWEDADLLAEFAKENNLKMRGHALVWHQQTGGWIFENESGGNVNKKELLKRMKNHIDSVVPRYSDIIYAWDVVNEAVADDSTKVYRESEWLKIAGKDFLVKAFEYAREADSNVKLFYNDYNAIIPEKRDRIIELLKYLQENNAPIDGVGIQAHWSIYGPSEAELREALDLYSELGLEIQITELDVSLYPWEKERRELKEGESDEFTPELEQKQIEAYDMFFRVFRDYKDVITGVTFWNISDRYSWLDTYPVAGRKNYPLLFDENFERKKAYEKVVEFETQPETKTP
ncbi:endo-1,4-beta-xylanase [Salegentibacter salegens]|uniref:Beta-xylanase n=2 Tax=Salegentibacter salegens TaxID=143223 RepID=A0A1M7N5K8_9FLAO|nr:endo-1,4-beta-xylanase [Salegentibacter salegens]SHM98775.1 endo-1,4-beta-xylanase [Salegentibacter salegens]